MQRLTVTAECLTQGNFAGKWEMIENGLYKTKTNVTASEQPNVTQAMFRQTLILNEKMLLPLS